MKLFILGLIILLIVVCQIYKLIKEKEKNENDNKEEMSELEYKRKKKRHDDFITENINYYDNILNRNLAIKKIKRKGKKYDKFVRLNTDNQLVYENYNTKEGFANNNRTKTFNEMDKCRAITECKMLDEPGYENCGYCGDLGGKIGGGGGEGYNQKGKFDYRPKATGGKIVGPDVCPADALERVIPKGKSFPNALGNRWATTAYDCEKIKLQDMCSSVQNCNELTKNDSGTGLGDVCGWCPANKAYPRTSDYQLKYDADLEKSKQTDVKGDTCSALNQTYMNEDNVLTNYFDKLQEASECSSCDNEGGGYYDENNNYRHSNTCLQDLWSAPLVSEEQKLKISCNTDFDSPVEADEGGIWYKNYSDTQVDDGREYYNWGGEEYYKVQKDMQQNVSYPIYSFKKDYNQEAEGRRLWQYGDMDGDSVDTMVRRKWIMNDDIDGNYNASRYSGTVHKNSRVDVKNLYKSCFNLENTNNDLKCVPTAKFRNMKGKTTVIDYKDPETGINYTMDGLYRNFLNYCSNLTGNKDCEKVVDDEQICEIQNK